ncbi:SPFH domain-containing protein [Legionella sp. CNM-4043-24]|uniref:SPFH domain-containing protein n=1 Tax=Legionella sp. CNM-4043-24 TaxID=3421646 RepID=UPI00403ACC22
MKALGRFLLGVAYAAVPVLGWYMLYKSFKRVKSDQISMIQDVSGQVRLIEEGIWFRPFPGDSFGPVFNKAVDFIDFGPIKRVRIKANELAYKTDANGQLVLLQPGIHLIHAAQNETFDRHTQIKDRQQDINDFGAKIIVRIREGFLGVKTAADGRYIELPPGIHEIDCAAGETFDAATGIQNIGQDDFVLGNKRYVTIRNGEAGECYRNGIFVYLEPGTHVLPSTDRFEKKVPVDTDVIDLGALKVVTVKEGQVAFVNTENGVVERGPGKHLISQTEGNYFNSIINTCPQGIRLPPLTVMCADQIEMRAESVLIFHVEKPLLTVGLGIDRIVEFLKVFADGTLRTILSRFNSSDIAPSLHVDDDHHSTIRSSKLSDLHKECVEALDEKARAWGLCVTELQITEILPADEEYLATIRNLGSQQSTAEANRRLAESQAAIAQITAKAGESKVMAAEIEQREGIVRAETEARVRAIQTGAESDQIMAKARAEAEAITSVSTAEAHRIRLLKDVAENAPAVIHDLMRIDAQGEIIKQARNPVFVQPGLGDTSFLTKENNGMTFFSTKKDGNSITDAIVLQAGGSQLNQITSTASMLN